ncbi:hypothetical protein [Pseudomonas azotoformans]
MTKYHVVASSPDSYKGVTGLIYTIYEGENRVRGIPHYDVESTANAVRDALINGDQLIAELRYRHKYTPQSAAILTTFAPAEEVLFYHVQDQLPATISMSNDPAVHRAQALKEAGYDEPVVSWLPAKGR